MKRLSDKIEEFIKIMIEESTDNYLEIQRNELAYSFQCAPSQINYVLATRFTINRGYYIESRRGGGGCIKITWVNMNNDDYIKSTVWNNIGDNISYFEGDGYITLCKERGLITDREARLMRTIINDKTMAVSVAEVYKNSFRAQLLKTMLITILC